MVQIEENDNAANLGSGNAIYEDQLLGDQNFDNVCVNVSIMTDDEEDEEGCRRPNCGEDILESEDNSEKGDEEEDDDESNKSEGDEHGGNYGSVYYDSDELRSCYSENEKEDGDAPTRKPTHLEKVRCDPDTVIHVFSVGMIFRDREECRHALAKYAIMKKLHVHFVKNHTRRVRAKCYTGCPWVFLANASSQMLIKWQQASFWKLTYRMGQPYIKLIDLQAICRTELHLKVSLTLCKNVKTKLHDDIIAVTKEEYRRLYDYEEEIMVSNRGSSCFVTSTREGEVNRFNRIRIIDMDGCFLKRLCKGQLLCAIGRDGNNQMFPIAWAVVQVENRDNLAWLLRCLKRDLPLEQGDGYVIISDMQKDLESAMKEYLPEVEHRRCARHVYANLAKQWKGEDRKIGFWTCAKSTFKQQLAESFKKLELLGGGMVSHVLEYDVETFCKVYFKTSTKCDVIDNNLAETFNGRILDARSLPIISMLEAIRVQVMTRLHLKRDACETWINDIAPRAMTKLEKNISKSCNWKLTFNGNTEYEKPNIYNVDRHVVNTALRTCSCREWDLIGLPCQHSIPAIHSAKGKPEHYVHEWYKVDKYKVAYQFMLRRMRAPQHRRMPGRPKKARKRDIHETKKTLVSETGKLSRQGRVMRCKTCGQPGHNIRGCPNRDPTLPAKQARPRKKGDKASTSEPPRPSADLIAHFGGKRKRHRQRASAELQAQFG
ncbi:uncharacterized protein LOC126657037 [Mercurialis annua]|uniref:uncharacterized protein LOC126657037 n=1 Tax=Mercurialis annua TaxID=3986 RepID=UPI00215F9FF5|nr:uncharacterized protein LOC126657037 [Mercurialis annua]